MEEAIRAGETFSYFINHRSQIADNKEYLHQRALEYREKVVRLVPASAACISPVWKVKIETAVERLNRETDNFLTPVNRAHPEAQFDHLLAAYHELRRWLE